MEIEELKKTISEADNQLRTCDDAFKGMLSVVSHIQERSKNAMAWVGLTLISCPAAQPLLPNSHQPKQSRADSGTLKIQVNRTQSQLTWDTLYTVDLRQQGQWK